jgi:hypothetical protein
MPPEYGGNLERRQLDTVSFVVMLVMFHKYYVHIINHYSAPPSAAEGILP